MRKRRPNKTAGQAEVIPLYPAETKPQTDRVPGSRGPLNAQADRVGLSHSPVRVQRAGRRLPALSVTRSSLQRRSVGASLFGAGNQSEKFGQEGNA